MYNEGDKTTASKIITIYERSNLETTSQQCLK